MSDACSNKHPIAMAGETWFSKTFNGLLNLNHSSTKGRPLTSPSLSPPCHLLSLSHLSCNSPSVSIHYFFSFLFLFQICRRPTSSINPSSYTIFNQGHWKVIDYFMLLFIGVLS
ncbi:hypothetical protein Ancab_029123 [Ancistrocladus abbreviatus]